MISNSGHDENNKYSGGKAGDQTGTEWQMRTWYSRPWNCVLRHPDPNIRNLIAELAEEAAANDKIGYDQSQRTTFWDELTKVGYHPKNITNPCEADCSAGVAAIVKAVGYLTGDAKLKAVSQHVYTGNERSALRNAGFEVLTASKYLTSDACLVRGDILLNDNAHTAINCGNGSSAGSTTTSSASTTSSAALRRGSTGSAVKTMQSMLIACGYSCGKSGADGSFGPDTEKAVRAFQTAYKLEVDGIYGPNSKAKLTSVYNGLKTGTSSNTSSSWVSRLQKAIGAKVDGVAGPETHGKCPTLRRNSKGAVVGLMQERLVAEGFSVGSSGVDNSFGPDTEKAVKAFQAANGLTQDGICGPNTWRKLLKL